MKNIYRADTKKLSDLWDKGNLKDCYCLLFSDLYGFRIIWNDENGNAHRLDKKDSNTLILKSFFIVLAVYETEDEAKNHFNDFVKWTD